MPSIALHRFSLLTAIATLGLIALGGMVTSHGVGMAVPDWPNTYGYNMFFFPVSQWVGGIFYEHTHRLLASAVGLLTGVLALWLHGYRAQKFMRVLGVVLLVLGGGVLVMLPTRWTDTLVLAATGAALVVGGVFWPSGEPAPKWLRRMGLVAFGAVVFQGVLGGLRVTAMKDEIGIFHATLAQLFFSFLCAICLFTSKWFGKLPNAGASPTSVHAKRMQRLFIGTTALILIQLVLGASMRHQHAGLAIPDFPTAYGRLWPDTSAEAVELYNQRRIEVTAVNHITAGQIHLQMLHRIVALAITAGVIYCALRARRQRQGAPVLYRLSIGWAGLIILQAALGAFTIWSNKAADVATAHVVLGALSLATGTIVSIVSVRLWSVAGQNVVTSVDCSPVRSFTAPSQSSPACGG